MLESWGSVEDTDGRGWLYHGGRPSMLYEVILNVPAPYSTSMICMNDVIVDGRE